MSEVQKLEENPELKTIARVELELALAEKLFDAYNSQQPNPWKAYDGKQVPRWAELDPLPHGAQVKAKWIAVARAAVDAQTAETAKLLEMAWGLIANAGVSLGDWKSLPKDWQDAAAKWRDSYHGGTPG